MGKLSVCRKGHTRKAYTAKRGDSKKVKVAKTRIKSSTFKISDPGKAGSWT